jgi:tetratricopeptide (TPR) repeat protein
MIPRHHDRFGTVLTPGRNEACPCGSGRKFKHCCGHLDGRSAAAGEPPAAELTDLASMLHGACDADLERRAREMLIRHPRSGVVWQALAMALSRQGWNALPALEQAARLLPQDAGVRNNLANALVRAGQFERAIVQYRYALRLDPQFAEARANLGNALLEHGNALHENGRMDEAIAAYREAALIRPELAAAHNNLGSALRARGLLDEAIACFNQALTLQPDFIDALGNLATALRLRGRPSEAQAICERALLLNPDLVAALLVMAESQADQGRFLQAESLYRRAMAIEPPHAEAWAGFARLRRMTSRDADWLARALPLAESGILPRQEIALRHAIGKYFEDVQDFEQAFQQHRRANEIAKRTGPAHDRARLSHAIDLTIRSFEHPQALRVGNDESRSRRAVFVVGMLRSGTSLTEQILASHPDVFGAGELSFWSNLAAVQSAAGPAATATPSQLAAAAQAYLQLLQQLSPGALRVVDKMPTNFMFLGMIHSALPEARIIHMQRDPIDTCLSIYFQHFESGVSYANDLDDLAHCYREYQRLMRLWRSILPAGTLLEVPYEALVQDQERWSRKMLDHIGLDWDPRCLEFFRTDRNVITASRWQVRQRLSRTSVQRWRNYTAYIQPLLGLASQPDQ